MTLYRSDIEFAAKQYGVDPNVLEALVVVESGGKADAFRYEKEFYGRYLADKPFFAAFNNPRRVSSSYGLGQVMFSTAVQYGFNGQPESLFLPNVNLDFAAKILSALLTRFDWRLEYALAAYNGGPGNHDKPGPLAYARKVIAARNKIEAERASQTDTGPDVPGGGAA